MDINLLIGRRDTIVNSIGIEYKNLNLLQSNLAFLTGEEKTDLYKDLLSLLLEMDSKGFNVRGIDVLRDMIKEKQFDH